jgi:hypothetical protein
MRHVTISRHAGQGTGFQLRTLAPLVPVLLLIPIAISIGYTADFGLAYRGGAEAWASGHPQHLVTWTATPFLALLMAMVTRVASEDTAARVFMAGNLAVWAALLMSVWNRVRDLLPSRWWWSTLAAAGVFAPAISTLFWLQFNLVVFALALAGFTLAGRHHRWAGFLIGLSVALKPIVVLLPLALVLRRRSRRAGAWAIGMTAASTALGLAFLAWRAGDPRVLNPFDYLAGFLTKGSGPIAACVPENYSPVALLCRLGLAPSTAITVAVGAAVVLTGWLLIRNLPAAPEGEWEVFAAACLFSTMLGPINWASYGMAMAPLFLLLIWQFSRQGAPARLWVGLAVAFVLAELVWDPMESLVRTPVPVVILSYTAGQFAQYILLLVWVRWRQMRSAAVWSSAFRR